MDLSNDNTDSQQRLPCNSDDSRVLEEFRRGLCKEIEATRQALQGKQAQLNAIERHMGIKKR